MTDGEAPAYRAFISYSHADAVFGRRLHRRLEAYRLPRRLVGRPTPGGPAPPRLTPIFRDRDELAATGDLSAEVRAALARSGALVVVCSPAAAASTWVAREVELFRELHADRPILAALVAGHPADAFPPAMRPAGGPEPLAADFRATGDGERLGLLKLVAGLIGVGLDELIQRDAQRRLQRVTAVTVTAVAAMLVMAGMTSVALSARAEAQRQRAEAEGLVEFMLTDLRDRLKGVGRLDVLTAANQRALAYYGDQDIRRLPPDSLGRRARILHAMGEDDELRGELDAASGAFLEARRATAALLAAAPNDPQRIFDQAQSEYWVAFVALRRGQRTVAEAGFERYAALAKRLLDIEPGNPVWRMEAAYAENNLGLVAIGDPSRAAQSEGRFRKAIDQMNAAARSARGDLNIQREIANVFGWLAISQRVQGRFDAARRSSAEEARIISRLVAADSGSHAYDRLRLGNAFGSAMIDLDDHRPKDALRILLPAYAEAGRLAALDPKANWLSRQRMAIGLALARASLESGAGPEKANRYLTACRAEDATSDQELRDFCEVTIARIAASQGDLEPARSYLKSNSDRLKAEHISAHWGLNFYSELKLITSKAKEIRS